MIDLVIIPVLTGYERAARLVESLYTQTLLPQAVLVVNNGIARFETPALDREPGLQVATPGHNIGVAASWNLGLRAARRASGESRVLVLNDDVVLTQDALQSYADALGDADENVVVIGPVEHPYSAWCCRAEMLLEEVGELDEQFWPAYYEDDDLSYRIALAGLRVKLVDNEQLGVAQLASGAMTTADLGESGTEWLRRCYDKNMRLYDAKWGGQPPHELYSKPYDTTSIDIEGGGYRHLQTHPR